MYLHDTMAPWQHDALLRKCTHSTPPTIGSKNPNSFQLSGEKPIKWAMFWVVVAKALLMRLLHIALQGAVRPPALLARLVLFSFRHGCYTTANTIQCESCAQCDTFTQCETFAQCDTFTQCETFDQCDTFSVWNFCSVWSFSCMGRFRVNNTPPSSERGARFLIVGRERVSAYHLWECQCYRLWQCRLDPKVHCEMLACCQQAVHATLNRLLNVKEQEWKNKVLHWSQTAEPSFGYQVIYNKRAWHGSIWRLKGYYQNWCHCCWSSALRQKNWGATPKDDNPTRSLEITSAITNGKVQVY